MREDMQPEDLAKLLEDLEHEILLGCSNIGVLGATRATLRILDALSTPGLTVSTTVYCDVPGLGPSDWLPYQALAGANHDVLVVAADDEKEEILAAALPHVVGAPRVLVAGYGHLAFRDELFEKMTAELLVPSLANGYPNSLIHLYQCLTNAARLNLDGVVVEFGTFKGGTAMFLARVIKQLGQAWPVLTFDTFDGFPPRRSPLDMYDHPDCVFADLGSVRQYLSGWNVEIISGDIVDTAAAHLEGSRVVAAFVDTDNYSSAKAAVNVLRDQTVVGGAIVFDHLTGVDRFRYTLGERWAAREMLDDPNYFNLHGTGVFIRQR